MIVFSVTLASNKYLSGFIARFMFVFLLMISTVSADTGQGKVALIAASGSSIEAMPLRDIRRLYLGLKLADDKSVISPVINHQSAELYDDFLKNIMRMTAGSYKRKLVKGIFRQGKQEILEVASLKELNDHLLKNKGNISFVQVSSIEKMENIEIVQILW